MTDLPSRLQNPQRSHHQHPARVATSASGRPTTRPTAATAAPTGGPRVSVVVFGVKKEVTLCRASEMDCHWLSSNILACFHGDLPCLYSFLFLVLMGLKRATSIIDGRAEEILFGWDLIGCRISDWQHYFVASHAVVSPDSRPG